MKQVSIGTWAEIPTPYVTHILSKAGADFSIIDMEHGVIDFALAQNMIFAAHSEGKQIFIRVPAIEEAWILRSLDTGCDGMIFPGVASTRDVERIIQYACFPPVGMRGFNPFITAGGYAGGDEEYFARENDRVQLGIILEGKEAFDQIDSILRYDQIDIVYIGQYDLSMALGIPGQVSDPLILSYLARAAEKINSVGKRAGCMVHTVIEAKSMIEQGFDFIVYKVDSGILFKDMSDFVKGINTNEAV